MGWVGQSGWGGWGVVLWRDVTWGIGWGRVVGWGGMGSDGMRGRRLLSEHSYLLKGGPSASPFFFVLGSFASPEIGGNPIHFLVDLWGAIMILANSCLFGGDRCRWRLLSEH